MWYRDRVWIQYLKNILASDSSSARFLERYTLRVSISKEYTTALEIIDLQRYRVIRNTQKVRNSLNEKKNKPFIFVVCKN
jgi:hypothetical protein